MEMITSRTNPLCTHFRKLASSKAYREETGDDTPTVVVSTASPFKFCDSVLDAIGVEPAGDSFQRIEQLEKAGGVSAPRPLTALRGRPERFRQAADRTGMERVVRDFLG